MRRSHRRRLRTEERCHCRNAAVATAAGGTAGGAELEAIAREGASCDCSSDAGPRDL